MKTLLRSVSLSLLCVTFFATSAAADCSWVLWSHTDRWTGGGSQETEWGIVEAVDSRSACDLAYQHVKVNHEARGWKPPVPESTLLSFQGTLSDGRTLLSLIEWRCLPDTVDPRGPKGK